MLDQSRQAVADLSGDLLSFLRFGHFCHQLGERYGHGLEQQFRVETGVVGLSRQGQERVGSPRQRCCLTRLTKRGQIDGFRHSSSTWQSTCIKGAAKPMHLQAVAEKAKADMPGGRWWA